MFAEFRNFIESQHLVKPDNKVLIAVSGGMDSMVLLDLFRRTEFTIGVGHINHGTRNEESDKDEVLVRTYCKQHHIQFFQKKLDFSSTQSNFQEIAREERQKFLLHILNKHHYDLIATAHHSDDEIENLFIRLNRSAGLVGLSGMKAKSQLFIKPMLFATKAQIQHFSSNENISFREDASNATSKYARNYIRNEVIPIIEDKFPNFRDNAKTSIEYLKEASQLLNYIVKKTDQRVCVKKGTQSIIDLKKISEYPTPSYMFYLLVKKRGLNRTQSDNLYFAKTGVKITCKKHLFLKNRHQVIIKPIENKIEKVFIFERDSKEVKLGVGEKLTQEAAEYKSKCSDRSILIDTEKLTFPLKIRHRRKGDMFYPKGMNMKKKKIKKFLIDLKLNHFEKEKVWILTDHLDQIIWVMGLRQDERFLPTVDSTFIHKLSFDSQHE